MKKIVTIFITLAILCVGCTKELLTPEPEEVKVTFSIHGCHLVNMDGYSYWVRPISVTDGEIEDRENSHSVYTIPEIYPDRIQLYGLSGKRTGELFSVTGEITLPIGEYFVSGCYAGFFGGRTPIDYLGLKEEEPHIDFCISPKECIDIPSTGDRLYGYTISIQNSGTIELDVQASSIIFYTTEDLVDFDRCGFPMEYYDHHNWISPNEKGAKNSRLRWKWWIGFNVPIRYLYPENSGVLDLQLRIGNTAVQLPVPRNFVGLYEIHKK